MGKYIMQFCHFVFFFLKVFPEILIESFLKSFFIYRAKEMQFENLNRYKSLTCNSSDCRPAWKAPVHMQISSTIHYKSENVFSLTILLQNKYTKWYFSIYIKFCVYRSACNTCMCADFVDVCKFIYIHTYILYYLIKPLTKQSPFTKLYYIYSTATVLPIYYIGTHALAVFNCN